MKIIYHHRTLGDGAEGIHIAEMVEAFRQAGHQVTVVGPVGEQVASPAAATSRFARLKKLIPSFLYEFMELGYNIYGYYLLRREIKRLRPDFIYDRYITFNASAVFIGKKFGIPVFLEVNAPLALERSEQKDEKLYLQKIAFSLERWICNNSFKTVVVSTPLKKYLIDQGVAEDKIIVLPNGVNTQKFKPLPRDMSLLAGLNFPEDCLVIGFVGILRPWHGIDMLLAAFVEIYQQHPHARLLIVGDGPIRNELEERIVQAGLQGKAVITGRVKHHEVARYISLFDIAVSPKATFYASPMKILEYMALGKPVVAPDTENIRDILNDTCSILFSEGDKVSLTSALNILSCNRQSMKRMGAQSLILITTRFQWANNAAKIISLLPTS